MLLALFDLPDTDGRPGQTPPYTSARPSLVAKHAAPPMAHLHGMKRMKVDGPSHAAQSGLSTGGNGPHADHTQAAQRPSTTVVHAFGLGPAMPPALNGSFGGYQSSHDMGVVSPLTDSTDLCRAGHLPMDGNGDSVPSNGLRHE